MRLSLIALFVCLLLPAAAHAATAEVRPAPDGGRELVITAGPEDNDIFTSYVNPELQVGDGFANQPVTPGPGCHEKNPGSRDVLCAADVRRVVVDLGAGNDTVQEDVHFPLVVTCGPGVDKVVDAHPQDRVAADCEEGSEVPVTRGLSVGPIRLRTLLRSGMTARLASPTAGHAELSLLLDPRTARRLDLPARIGHAVREFGEKENPTLVVHLTHVAAARVKRLTRLAFTLHVDVAGPEGPRVAFDDAVVARR